jgi:hypothetical protein
VREESKDLNTTKTKRGRPSNVDKEALENLDKAIKVSEGEHFKKVIASIRNGKLKMSEAMAKKKASVEGLKIGRQWYRTILKNVNASSPKKPGPRQYMPKALEDKIYDNLPEASEDEEDMLDQAFGLTPTSRLGCQVLLDETLEGMTIVVPKATRNMAVDGYVAKPH